MDLHGFVAYPSVYWLHDIMVQQFCGEAHCEIYMYNHNKLES